MAEAQPSCGWSDLAGSESHFDVKCQPCGYEGNDIEAAGYCLDCCEYLCSSCFRYHKNLAITRTHKLVNKDKAPLNQDNAKIKDACTQKCQSHEDEIVKYFCPAHQVLGCSVCVTLKHKLCEDVEYIPEASKDLENSENYNDFRTRLRELMIQSESIITSTAEKLDTVTDNYNKVLQDFLKYKEGILEQLNKMESDIKSQLEDIKGTHTARLNTINYTCTRALETLQSVSSEFEELSIKKKNCQMFIHMKNTEKTLSQLKEKFQHLKGIWVTTFHFKSKEDVDTISEKLESFGKIVEKLPITTELSYMEDVNTRSLNDKMECTISSTTVLSGEKLVMTDSQNVTIKVYDAIQNAVVAEMSLWSMPWDVTTVDQDQVAVTLPFQKKVIFSKL